MTLKPSLVQTFFKITIYYIISNQSKLDTQKYFFFSRKKRNFIYVIFKENIKKLTEMMEQHRERLMSAHELLAEKKLRKTEMSVGLK